MLLSDVEELLVYWERFPPPHISLRLLAGALAGWKPPMKTNAAPFVPSSQDEVTAFIAAVNADLEWRG